MCVVLIIYVSFFTLIYFLSKCSFLIIISLFILSLILKAIGVVPHTRVVAYMEKNNIETPLFIYFIMLICSVPFYSFIVKSVLCFL